jgi:hypothetical protein
LQHRDAPEGTRLLELTPAKIKFLWDKLSNISGLWDDYTKGDFNKFLRVLEQPNSVWYEMEDGNGILYLTNIIPGLSASAHFVYWDRKLRVREEFTKDCLRFAVSVLNLEKINVYLPDYAKAAIHFAQKLGFKREGRIRAWSYFDGRLFDEFIFGITREEVFDVRVHGTDDGTGDV